MLILFIKWNLFSVMELRGICIDREQLKEMENVLEVIAILSCSIRNLPSI